MYKINIFMQCAPESLWVFSAWICKFCTWSRKTIQLLIYQNLHIHAVRAKILWSIFEPEGRCTNLTSEVRFVHLLIDRLIWPVWEVHVSIDRILHVQLYALIWLAEKGTHLTRNFWPARGVWGGVWDSMCIFSHFSEFRIFRIQNLHARMHDCNMLTRIANVTSI